MYTLHVSYDCGTTYAPERTAETLDELRPRMHELDGQRLRWYVEEDGEQCFDVACGIHRGIINFMRTVRGDSTRQED